MSQCPYVGVAGRSPSWSSQQEHIPALKKHELSALRALQISMGAPLFVSEDELRDEFSGELIQLYGVDEAKERVVLGPDENCNSRIYKTPNTN